MTAEALSFEPVQQGDCTLAPTPSMARTMRFKQLGIAKGKQPVGTTVDVICGDPLCFSPDTQSCGSGRALVGSGRLWPQRLQGCRSAAFLTCPTTPSMRHQGTDSGAASARRLLGGCCGSRSTACAQAASVSRALERGAWRALSDDNSLDESVRRVDELPCYHNRSTLPGRSHGQYHQNPIAPKTIAGAAKSSAMAIALIG
jgi:hypothetical protein